MFWRWRSVTSAAPASARPTSGAAGASWTTKKRLKVQTPSSEPSDDSRVTAKRTT